MATQKSRIAELEGNVSIVQEAANKAKKDFLAARERTAKQAHEVWKCLYLALIAVKSR